MCRGIATTYCHLEQNRIFQGSSFGQPVIAVAIGAHLSSIKTPWIFEDHLVFCSISRIQYILWEGPFKEFYLDFVVFQTSRDAF